MVAKSIHFKREMDILFYEESFILGTRSTQLSERVNSDIKSFINRNLDIIKFFKRFEDVVEEKRYNKPKCEYEAHQKVRRLKNTYSYILQQMFELYILTIFNLFQHKHELFKHVRRRA